jgi:hypothetical protein
MGIYERLKIYTQTVLAESAKEHVVHLQSTRFSEMKKAACTTIRTLLGIGSKLGKEQHP